MRVRVAVGWVPVSVGVGVDVLVDVAVLVLVAVGVSVEVAVGVSVEVAVGVVVSVAVVVTVGVMVIVGVRGKVCFQNELLPSEKADALLPIAVFCAYETVAGIRKNTKTSTTPRANARTQAYTPECLFNPA